MKSRLQNASKNLLEQSGLDVSGLSSSTSSAVSSATDAYAAASPTINQAVNFLTTTAPEDLAKAGLALVGAYYLLPFAIKAFIGSLRGFSGTFRTSASVFKDK